MKSPIIIEGEPFNWERAAPAAKHAVDADGTVNWGAAMCADPGVMKCPKCGVYLWHEGTLVECPDCSHRWDTRER